MSKTAMIGKDYNPPGGSFEEASIYRRLYRKNVSEKRVLFLDIDGVLNSDSWHMASATIPSIKTDESIQDFVDYQVYNCINPIALGNLVYFLENEACGLVDIVLSSTWRAMCSHVQLKNSISKIHGIRLPIISSTGTETSLTEGGAQIIADRQWTIPSSMPRGTFLGEFKRGNQIANWLASHTAYNIAAALDDDNDIFPEILVKTDNRLGLTPYDIDKLIKTLKV